MGYIVVAAIKVAAKLLTVQIVGLEARTGPNHFLVG